MAPHLSEARAMLRTLQQVTELLTCELTIAQDSGQEAGTDCLPGVDGNSCAAPVPMAKQVVTAFDANQFEPGSRQSSNNIPAGEAREPGHPATETR